MFRIRVTYTKSKEAAYIPAEDLVKVLERAFTRIGGCIAYTKEKRPNIQVANPLPLGIDSTSEICDVEILEYIESAFITKSLNKVLPSGMVALSAEYLSDGVQGIEDSVYASVYEIIPEYENVEKMTNKEYADLREWYRTVLEQYMKEPQMMVLVKSGNRNERIDIKPSIMEYSISINDALHVTFATNTEYNFNPNYIMDGFLEYIDQKIPYKIKREKILYK
ncbi:MAG: TIGR03936 family radical SAM-associated protein [Clostridia bacterium]|nr:TIGR03936 family radical SAM-associated protein [Clostridia bacterium]